MMKDMVESALEQTGLVDLVSSWVDHAQARANLFKLIGLAREFSDAHAETLASAFSSVASAAALNSSGFFQIDARASVSNPSSTLVPAGKMLSMAITACLARGKYVGICGQGPSDHPDLAKWLMEQGIESVSLNPDSVLDTWFFLAEGQAPA